MSWGKCVADWIACLWQAIILVVYKLKLLWGLNFMSLWSRNKSVYVVNGLQNLRYWLNYWDLFLTECASCMPTCLHFPSQLSQILVTETDYTCVKLLITKRCISCIVWTDTANHFTTKWRSPCLCWCRCQHLQKQKIFKMSCLFSIQKHYSLGLVNTDYWNKKMENSLAHTCISLMSQQFEGGLRTVNLRPAQRRFQIAGNVFNFGLDCLFITLCTPTLCWHKGSIKINPIHSTPNLAESTADLHDHHSSASCVNTLVFL